MPKYTLMSMHFKRFSSAMLCGGAVALGAVTSAEGQEAPVYVDDSPFAWELFREAQEQAAVNVGESVRLYQDILDELALRLIPADSVSPNRFQAARLRVLDELMNDDAPGGLLERHRIMEHAEAQRLQQAGDFERLVLTRPWTQPGLDALLRIAQRDIESARFDAAGAVLDLAIRHPDLAGDPRAAAFTWYMRCVAAHYANDIADLEEATQQLRMLSGEGNRLAEMLAVQLTRIEAEPAPEIPIGISPLNVGTVSPSVALEELVAEEIWSVPLPDTLYNRRYVQNTGRTARRGREQALADGLLMTASPTVVSTASGGLVYVNQGHHILALDRFTGSPMWPMVGGYVERSPLTIIDREDDHARDLNVISVQNDVLVTLTGHAHVSSRSNEGRVLCLDAYTGEYRWSTRIDRIAVDGADADEHEGLFPYSEPVIAEGKVFVLARKVSPQALTSTYLVALHIEDGAPVWVSHIASSGTVRRAARSFSTLVYNGGDLYLATAVGAITRVDAATGQIRWLHRYAVPLNPTTAEQMRRPWELTAPVVTRHYVINLLPAVPGFGTGGQRVLVLDRETGHEVAALSTDEAGWGSPTYLLCAGEHSPWIYAVGREVRAIHVSALEQPAWALRNDGFGRPLELQGRVQVVAAHEGADVEPHPALIVPNGSAILIVDGVSGRILNRLEPAAKADDLRASEEPSSGAMGNPVVVDSQLFIADNQRLRSYMAMNHAVGMLRERIDAHPADPEPGVALLRLAIAAAAADGMERAGHFDLIMASAQAVMRSLELARTDSVAMDIQNRLFSLLLSSELRTAIANSQQGEAIFAMIRQVIAIERPGQENQTHAQRLDYLLAYGDWQANQEGGAAEAAEAYRTVLKQPALASIKRREGDVVRPGQAWAMRRLASHGKQDAQDTSFATADHRYPMPPLPAIGSQRGSALLLDGGLIRHSPVANVNARGGAIDHLTAAILLDGSRLRVYEASDSSRQSGELSEHWALDVSSAGITGDADGVSRAWALDRARTLLWLGASRSGVPSGWFVMVDSKEGRPLWASPGVDAIFGEVTRRFRTSGSDAAGRAARQFASGGRGASDSVEPLDLAELIPLVGNNAALLVRRDGSVAKFDFDGGATPAWVATAVLDEIHHAALGADYLVVVGLTRNAATTGRAARRSDTLVPAFVAIELASGKTMHDAAPLLLLGPDEEESESSDHATLNWMCHDSSGVLVVATPSGVQAWDVAAGSFVWKNTSPIARNTQRGWAAGQRVFFEAREGELHSIHLEDATICSGLNDEHSRQGLPMLDDSGPVRNVMLYETQASESVASRVLVHRSQRIAWYDADGGVLGRDAIQDERNYRWVLPASDRIIVVNARQPRQQPARGLEGGGRRTHHVYSIYALSSDGRLLHDPLELPALYDPIRDAQLIDGWLLLTTSAHTIAVPFPVAR